MEYIEVTGKTVDDAITEACQKLEVTSDRLDYEVVEKGSSGFLGFGNKPALIKARVKSEENEAPAKEEKTEKPASKEEEKTQAPKADKKSEEKPASEKSSAPKSGVVGDPKEFLEKVFAAMDLKVDIKVEQTEEEMCVELSGDEMGILIGKRGQTLDSLQYLTSLYVNKNTNDYIRVKLDTENYRER